MILFWQFSFFSLVPEKKISGTRIPVLQYRKKRKRAYSNREGPILVPEIFSQDGQKTGFEKILVPEKKILVPEKFWDPIFG